MKTQFDVDIKIKDKFDKLDNMKDNFAILSVISFILFCVCLFLNLPYNIGIYQHYISIQLFTFLCFIVFFVVFVIYDLSCLTYEEDNGFQAISTEHLW